MAKILFIYPNISGIRRIPLGISILSACLKDKGHRVELFDYTFYLKNDMDNDKREEIEIVIPVDLKSVYKKYKQTDPIEDLKSIIRKFEPDIIAISVLQDNYVLAKKLISEISIITKSFILAGGVMPTVAPEFVLKNLKVNAIMIGESEKSLLLLAEKIEMNEDPYDCPNLGYANKYGDIIINEVYPIQNLTELPFHDYELFDEEHLWRPFIGKIWKTGYFELSRGCPFNCTFCANHKINSLYGKKGRIRSRSINRLIDEIKTYKGKYDLGLISFTDENFLSLKELKTFSEQWENNINLPFMIQSRIETISREKLEYLKTAGCITISIGIESGNEAFRKKYLKRNYSNQEVINAFKLCRDVDIRSTSNNIIGFPFETETEILDTINLNRESKPESVSIATFAPYMGTELYNLSVENNLIEHDYISEKGFSMYNSDLNFSEKHKAMIEYYIRNFNKLVYS